MFCILDIIFKILIDICTKITNEAFLQLYEKKFIDDLLVNNVNKLKSMEDQTNPLYHLLELSKTIDPTNNLLLRNLITACTKLIRLNNEEIRYETFTHPSKKTFTYAVLFDRLKDVSLLQGTIIQLDCMWNSWLHIGLTRDDIEKWKGHDSEEQIVFNKIWEKVRTFLKKGESVDTLFKKADQELSDKTIVQQAIVSALKFYCDKAVDYSDAMNSLRDMLNELDEKPIRSVKTPKALQDIQSIALKLSLFSESQVWINYYKPSFFRTGK